MTHSHNSTTCSSSVHVKKSIQCTVSSNFLLDKGSVAKNLQKECLCYWPDCKAILAYGLIMSVCLSVLLSVCLS